LRSLSDGCDLAFLDQNIERTIDFPSHNMRVS
jgi:hypothetical protein